MFSTLILSILALHIFFCLLSSLMGCLHFFLDIPCLPIPLVPIGALVLAENSNIASILRIRLAWLSAC